MKVDQNKNIDFTQLKITSNGPLSKEFIKLNCNNFQEAFAYIKKLPYKRNENKYLPLSVLTEQCGTCSTKHACLKMLAEENEWNHIKLLIGVFNMDLNFNHKVNQILSSNGLSHIPEAHCYLKIENQIMDCTFTNETGVKIDITHEKEIAASQSGDQKVTYHKSYLKKWLEQQPNLNLTLEEIWHIRELCIASLSS
ncbi:MAG: hypothetical protein IPF46_13685 [Saprospiraceae bacterium]|nr:hypothetical protein [Candidatus Vicinibacter affinis]MBP6172368.1 hypothetical protein [Saprospiraceae bacterium]MBK6823774.1 hypothetical protein [Candidatus Vicinibacter affinis]MBK7800218.1 hypothetical protein [Candidatus Vicinibacter affinis]MBK8404342.1 hypothetical protein [Candidatus Vicinibacter affinis]